MSPPYGKQHLYECERCHRYGIAHYILEDGRLVLVCTGCFRDKRKREPMV